MLERIREGSQGPWAMLIIGLVVLSFVFAGVGSYLNSSGETVAASVNGEEISLSELERAYQAQRSRMESQYGESITALFADEGYLKQFRQSVLDDLINEKLVQQKAEEIGLRISDEQIRNTIVNMPEFQLSGKFNNDRYLALLRQNGFQPSDFRDYLRTQLTREQLTRALGVSDFALPGEAKQLYALQAQTRNARFFTVSADSFAQSASVSDEEIESYYQSHITAFDTEEKVNVAYVSLSVDDLKGDVDVTDEDIAQYYEENLDLYREEEQRRVSHILIDRGDDETAAKAKAESLLKSIRDGADFAELAKENSDDTFSAENGGDLDFLTLGSMDDEFDNAVFALENVGDVSDVVETEYGYHIITLTDIKPEQVKSLAEVSDEIRDNLLNEKAAELFYDIHSRMAEVAFEVPDSLEEVAAIANQPIQETGLFARSQVPEEINFPQVVNDVFSPELIEDGVNSDLIELDDNNVMVVRVNDHEPQRTQSLDEVKDSIVASLREEKAQQGAQAWAEEQMTALNEGKAIADALAAKGISWQTAENVNRANTELPHNVVETLFTLASSEENTREVTLLGSGDVALVELTAVNPAPAADDVTLADIQQRLGAAYSQSLYDAYVSALRSQADVEINANR
ncbi:peptidylprolyl isomerase [Alteromonas sp. C1M14]|uniref:peptidylprolyl isomerase n=1 Tax=Alteromonas sp. C1M14 TaxID=2841567 RepID=UPI001C0886AC|nr:peptidylprolyl isomerase [Alteromonas sp. C1M14]MBU2979115.1 peptidylprolyl isomerase [Alteromonas sp. C1M14]